MLIDQDNQTTTYHFDYEEAIMYKNNKPLDPDQINKVTKLILSSLTKGENEDAIIYEEMSGVKI